MALLSDFICDLVAELMQCQPSDINDEAGFFEMGMDSLMAVELKNILEERLNCELDATLIFDYPNLFKFG